MPDLVGIGAINTDLIVDSSAARSVDLDDPRLGLRPEQIGAERVVTPDESRAALAYLEAFDPVVIIGGSALNVVTGVAATGAPLSVGYVGVGGLDGPVGRGWLDHLDRWSIDRRHVEPVDGPTGLCLAINHGPARTLLTTDGANGRLPELFRRRGSAIAAYLRTARAIHLTSLAGPADLSPIVEVLTAVVGADPTIRLSCDPGATWSDPDPTGGVWAVLRLCDRLLVNRRERDRLVDRTPAMTDADCAATLFERLPTLTELVVKGADRVDLHRRRGHSIETVGFVNPVVLAPDEIVDDTGAGDAFAAGFLVATLDNAVAAATTAPGGGPAVIGDPGAGARLGLALGAELARIKLGFRGTAGVDRYGPAYRRFIAGR